MARRAKGCHSRYSDSATRLLYNLLLNPSLPRSHPFSSLPFLSDSEMASGTPAEKMRLAEAAREKHIHNLISSLDEGKQAEEEEAGALMRCQRCQSTSISWEAKQTRSADEGMSIFCACNNCKQRWRLS